MSVAAAWFERWIFSGTVRLVGLISELSSRIGNGMDRYLINFGFDTACGSLQESGGEFASWQSGRVQGYLRAICIGMLVLLMVIGWLIA